MVHIRNPIFTIVIRMFSLGLICSFCLFFLSDVRYLDRYIRHSNCKILYIVRYIAIVRYLAHFLGQESSAKGLFNGIKLDFPDTVAGKCMYKLLDV